MEYTVKNQGRQEETHHPAHRFRRLFIDLLHPGVQDKRRVSEIDLSQPRHETALWWRHNWPMTSQLTDLI